MGCHTWFSRPVTKEEFQLIKEYAPISIGEWLEIANDCECEKTRKKYIYNYHVLMKSFTENIPCVYGKYWWELGYGSENPNLLSGKDNYIHKIRGHSGLFVDIEEYHDVFRVKNYPLKVIHSRRELRKWMRKKYFELEDWQLEKISEFFHKYLGGVITFG